MEVKVIALTLLLMRLSSMAFIGVVLRRQWRLIRLNDPPEVQATRIAILVLIGLVLIGNIAPIAIDVYALFLFDGTGTPGSLLTVYAFSNATTWLAMSVVWWLLHNMLARQSRDNASLTKENQQLRDDREPI